MDFSAFYSQTDGFDALPDLFRYACQSWGERIAYQRGNRAFTYREWLYAAEGVAARFEDMGVRKGDVVVLLLGSSIEYAVAYQAAAMLGAVTTGVNPHFGAGEMQKIIGLADPAVVVSSNPDEAALGGRQVLSLEELKTAAQSGRAPLSRPHLGPDDPVAIIWSSGTTGSPKGMVYDMRGLKNTALGNGYLCEPFDRLLFPVPFSAVGYMSRIWDFIRNATTQLIFEDEWSAAEHLRLVADGRPTTANGVPTMWRLLLRRPEFDGLDWTSLRVLVSGGADVGPELLKEVRQRTGRPMVATYATTEISIGTKPALDDELDTILNTTGRPSPGVEVKIVDDSGAELPNGQIGTLNIRSAAGMVGFWKNEVLTLQRIKPGGWIEMDDLALVEPDSGALRLMGRRGDAYIRGGYNVFPIEVEGRILEHELVQACTVVSSHDSVMGEVGVAFVVAADGLDEEGVKHWCRIRLAGFKVPERVVLVSQLPISSVSSKVDKGVLKQQADQLHAGGQKKNRQPT